MSLETGIGVMALREKIDQSRIGALAEDIRLMEAARRPAGGAGNITAN